MCRSIIIIIIIMLQPLALRHAVPVPSAIYKGHCACWIKTPIAILPALPKNRF